MSKHEREQGELVCLVERHPSCKLLIMRSDLIPVCDGDHAAAMILSGLIFKTECLATARENQRKSKKNAQIDPEPLYVFMSRADLCDMVHQHYKLSTIDSALETLRTQGLITTESKRGVREIRILVDHKEVDKRVKALPAEFSKNRELHRNTSSLKSKNYISKNRELQASSSLKTETKFVENREVETCYKEELSISSKEESISSQPSPSSELNNLQPQTQITEGTLTSPPTPSPLKQRPTSEFRRAFVPIDVNAAVGLWNRQRGAKKLNKTDEILFREKLEACSHSDQEITAAIAAFFADEYWRQQRFPVRGFLAQLDKFVDIGQELPQEAPELQDVLAPLGVTNAASLPAPTLPARVLEWNAEFPEDPVEHWTRHCPTKELAEAETDPEFRAKWPRILSTCRALKTGGRLNGVNFYWLFRRSQGKAPNWHRVVTGEYDWALPETCNSQRQDDSTDRMVDIILGRTAKTKSA